MKTRVIFSSLVLVATLSFVGCSGGSKSEVKADTGKVTLESLLQKAELKKAEISYRYHTIVPDSLKSEMRKWITETVRAASNQMAGGDYEDPEDVVEEVGELAYRLYSVSVKHVYLSFVPKGEANYNAEFVLYEDLTPSRKKVFDYLNR